MQTYKLGYAGASGMAVDRIQVIKSGKVKGVFIAATAFVDGAVDYDQGYIQVGVNAVSESGLASANPVNFAISNISSSRSVAAVEHSKDINVFVPADYAVVAGQDIVLSLAGLSQAGSNWEAVDILIMVA